MVQYDRTAPRPLGRAGRVFELRQMAVQNAH